jgi:hypothetical protein
MAGQSIGNPKYDWMLQSIPQAHLNDRAVFLPRLARIYILSLQFIEVISGAKELGDPVW